jgi:hypothetical protein
MINESLINIILKYILFFIVVYILTCFLEKKTVYFYLFIIFILAIISKIALYSTNQLLVSLSWIFLGFCIISLFADRIKNDNQQFGIVFDSLIMFLSIFGNIIKSIFTETQYSYTFSFMFLATLYASLISKGNKNIAILGWIIGLSIGFLIWFFLTPANKK